MKNVRFILLMFVIFSCKSPDYKNNPGLIVDDVAVSLRKDLVRNYKQKGKVSLAVVGFSRQDLIGQTAKYKSVTPKLGIMIANALQNEMFIPDKFDLLERQQVDSLLSETEFNQLGLTESGATQILRLKGVNAIVIGSVQQREKSFRFDARIVELESGQVKSVATKIVPFSDFLEKTYNDYPRKREACLAVIKADEGWQDTKCIIKDSSRLYITAKGEWNMTNAPYYFDAIGSFENPSNNGDYRLYQANHGALICRIGSKNIFIYRNNFSENIQGLQGILECRINDTAVGNNTGLMQIKVETEDSIK